MVRIKIADEYLYMPKGKGGKAREGDERELLRVIPMLEVCY